MKLTRGKGTPEKGGCWMAVNDFYARGVLNWTDQPDCVDPIIRPLCIRLNDWCDDGEREALIGPHVWVTMGTYSDELRAARLDKVVRFALDCAADALDVAGVEHGLRMQFANYSAATYAASAATYAASAATYVAYAAAYAAANAAYAATYAASAAYAATYVAAYAAAYAATNAANAANAKQRLLTLILDLCAMGTPTEVVPAVSKEHALAIVCGEVAQ